MENERSSYRELIDKLDDMEVFWIVEMAYQTLNDNFLKREMLNEYVGKHTQELSEIRESTQELRDLSIKLNLFMEHDNGYLGLQP